MGDLYTDMHSSNYEILWGDTGTVLRAVSNSAHTITMIGGVKNKRADEILRDWGYDKTCKKSETITIYHKKSKAG